ncbi:LPS assembly lipoprotein LptE [Roseobacter sinensis]|uniref:LPS assembly lipoprotein LptE n=1 Tax=Roseobacter sinensis TaxID=2931391 RepID=A0ABT3B9U0_9RHOB|nr:LPS assembly lipoprotein LptE [Roseobacter sp. WL0113]MCV3270204.1 LPS assembly lipoprotein LptE [Roseobacter sp. WL0113]
MSLFDRRSLLMLPLALAACGFTPVYAPGGSATKLQNNVTVSEPDTRNGFLVTQRIEERLGRAADPTYRLALSVSSSQQSLAVDREGNITRYNILGRADYSLVEANTGRVITSGQVDNFTGYSAAGTTVATLAAERDAERRLMVLLADQIVTRVLVADL